LTGIGTGLGPAAFFGDFTKKIEEGRDLYDSAVNGGVIGH